ncbi:MAG: DNA-binding protein WhiA [Clostridiales bacterium]|jgi:DNA-binding protein WhiA|nr:DNA-binding protein WhiA [Clostridiales bacterium]
MSFSSSVKSELCKISGDEPCCHRALLAALTFFAGRAVSKDKFVISTENAAISRLVHTLSKKIISENVHSSIKGRGKIHLYTLEVTDAANFLQSWGMSGFSRKINHDLLRRDCCKRSFIRGAFLGGGYIIAPDKAYHLEIITHFKQLRDDFCQILDFFDIQPKWTTRNGRYVFYFKGSEKISDLLAIMGAHNSMMHFLNVKIVKEMRGDANRLVNCESANVDKSISASLAQINAIENIGLRNIPENLQQIARLRMGHPHLSLKELGELHDPPMTKSVANHALQRIVKRSET